MAEAKQDPYLKAAIFQEASDIARDIEETLFDKGHDKNSIVFISLLLLAVKAGKQGEIAGFITRETTIEQVKAFWDNDSHLILELLK